MRRIEQSQKFAEEEYGHAQLGHKLRTQTLVRVASCYAANPGSKVTEVCKTSADRQAAYKFMENDQVEAKALREASAKAALRRSTKEEPYVLVAFDETSLNLTDKTGKKGFGWVGAHKQQSHGVCVLNAIGLGADGTPLGILGQKYWTRKKRVSGSKSQKKRRPVGKKETQKWLLLMDEIEALVHEEAPTRRLWFQADRGFDAWPVLRRFSTSPHVYTIRSVQNRLLAQEKSTSYLREALQKAPMEAHEVREVPLKQSKGARKAKLCVRSCQVNLVLTDPSRNGGKAERWKTDSEKQGVYQEMVYVVWVHEEQGSCPPGETPLDWMLLTNWPVVSVADARLVVENYACRWRVEEFHRLWKSGALRIEETQVRDLAHLEIVASMTAAVACYLFRLTHLARTKPQLPAREVLATEEFDALESLHPKATPTMTLAQAVGCIAELGGYTGFKNSGGPPGPLVLCRGYHRLKMAADAIRGFLQKRDQC